LSIEKLYKKYRSASQW